MLMLHDLISVKKAELDSFVADIESTTIQEGAHWKHANRSPHHSVSIKFDKYIATLLKEYILSTKPKQGAFANKSIYRLVEVHKENQFILTTDIKRYFEAITFDQVLGLLQKSGEVSGHTSLIEEFYFSKGGGLKRGLKASSAISELVGFKIDNIVQSLILKSDLEYSRYYDDLIFSGNDIEKLRALKEALSVKLEKVLSLELNRRKTKIRRIQGSKVLGLRFHDKQVKVPQSFKMKIRSLIHRYHTEQYDESDIYSVKDAKSHVGTIIGSIRYLLDYSPDLAKSQYEDLLAEYYDELNRLEDVRQKLMEEEEEDASWFYLP